MFKISSEAYRFSHRNVRSYYKSIVTNFTYTLTVDGWTLTVDGWTSKESNRSISSRLDVVHKYTNSNNVHAPNIRHAPQIWTSQSHLLLASNK